MFVFFRKFNVLKKRYLIFLLSLPFLAFSQGTTFSTFAANIIDLLNLSVGLIIGIALLVFVVGMIRFIAMSGDERGRSEGKQMMVWGAIAIFVMISVWGLVEIIRTTFFG